MNTDQDSITTKQQIDDLVDDFTSNILEAYRQSAPVIANNNSSKYIKLPKFIKDLIKTRNKSRRITKKKFRILRQ